MTPQIEFSRAKAQLYAELEDYIEKNNIEVTELPAFQYTQGETHFRFGVKELTGEQIFSALEILKAHHPILRVHTLEAGYTIFQTGEKQNSSKFRFVSIGTQKKVEVSREGDFSQDELQSCIRLYKLFHKDSKASGDPSARLASLGIPVFQRKDQSPWEIADSAEELSRRYPLAGYEATKEEILDSVILPLSRPELFQEVARLTRGSEQGILPKAVLFEGPPGVGKTSMARIIASETGIPLVYVPIENITSKFYGQSAQNMARIFDIAADYERVILFLDEIDSLGLSREGGLFEASRRILSVLLRKIDGLDRRGGVLSIGATNRREDLDGALLSRFDTIIHFPLPNSSERAQIFGRYARHLSKADLQALGEASSGLSGRNIEDVCEYVERRWSRRLLHEGASASPPPAELYLEVCQKKRSFS